MDIDTINNIKERIWFWKENKGWSSESVKEPSKRYDEIQKRLDDVKQRKSCLEVSYIFLVKQPYTFGHSQLVMEFRGEDVPNEAEHFKQAASTIQKALSAFKHELIPKTIERFSELAKVTLTEKSYIKTLILRTSADEDIHTNYKVHLVPYFESHEWACQKRYCAIHRVLSKERGGLVGWLGERETEVEKWGLKSETPWAFMLDEIANTKWKLPELAEQLAGA